MRHDQKGGIVIKTKTLIEQLKRFPENSWSYAYEGEVCGVVVVDRPGIYCTTYGYIKANEGDQIDDKVVIYSDEEGNNGRD